MSIVRSLRHQTCETARHAIEKWRSVHSLNHASGVGDNSAQVGKVIYTKELGLYFTGNESLKCSNGGSQTYLLIH